MRRSNSSVLGSGAWGLYRPPANQVQHCEKLPGAFSAPANVAGHSIGQTSRLPKRVLERDMTLFLNAMVICLPLIKWLPVRWTTTLFDLGGTPVRGTE